MSATGENLTETAQIADRSKEYYCEAQPVSYTVYVVVSQKLFKIVVAYITSD